MCFISYLNPEELIASKNIICYKIVLKTKEKNKVTAYMNPSHIYTLEKLNKKIKLNVHQYNLRYHIYEGYHSIITKDYLKRKYTLIDNMVYVKCIIPKGTKYYKNVTEMVSENIIIKKIIK